MRKLIEFDSGLKLAYFCNPYVRSVAIGVYVGAGVVKETEELSGISHFIEHMVFKGTKHRTGFQIVNELDGIGAQVNAFTAKCYTCFHTYSLDEDAKKCAEVLSDLYFDPTFDPEELEKERKVVIEEINEGEDTPDDVCLEALIGVAFDGHPLKKPILGTRKTLERMTSDTLEEYHKKHYIPSNTVLAIAGNITEDETIKLAEEFFESRFKKGGESPRIAGEVHKNHAFVQKVKRIEQTHISLSFPCCRYDDPAVVPTQLMTMIFGTEMSSRLFQSVREKLGLCYTVAGYPSFYRDAGMFTVYLSTSPHRANEAIDAILKEIDLLKREGVSEEELKKGKRQLKASIALGEESTRAMMRALGSHAIMTNKLYDVDARLSEIERTTQENVLEVSRDIFDTDAMCCSVVGPKKVDLSAYF